VSLSIPESVVESIKTQCVHAYPHECCGAMLGKILGAAKSVSHVQALANAEPSNPERRFVIDPDELNSVDRIARDAGLEVVGFYHSHPDAPARPSSTDREWAWPVYSYVIVSVMQGAVADIKSYELESDENDAGFVEETITL
jgi:proteasome lid subunit RPN8/RPN11